MSALVGEFVQKISTDAERSSMISNLSRPWFAGGLAADCFQDACVILLERPEIFTARDIGQDYDSFRRLFFGVARIRRLEYMRRGRVVAFSLDGETDDGARYAEILAAPDDLSVMRSAFVEARALKLSVLDLARGFSPQYFEVVKWVVLCGVPVERYGHRVGKTAGQVSAMVARASELLARESGLRSMVRLRPMAPELVVAPRSRGGRPATRRAELPDLQTRAAAFRAFQNSLPSFSGGVPSSARSIAAV